MCVCVCVRVCVCVCVCKCMYVCMYISMCMCWAVTIKQKTQSLFDEFLYSFNTY